MPIQVWKSKPAWNERTEPEKRKFSDRLAALVEAHLPSSERDEGGPYFLESECAALVVWTAANTGAGASPVDWLDDYFTPLYYDHDAQNTSKYLAARLAEKSLRQAQWYFRRQVR